MPTLAISQLYRGINKSFVNLGHLELHKQNAYKTKHDHRLTIIIQSPLELSTHFQIVTTVCSSGKHG